MNRNRGVSALRSTGLRQPLSVSKEPLPQPLLDPAKRSKIPVDENHGLWQFFNKQKTVFDTPEDHDAHGRAWTVEELRHKSWQDLHSLWWVCAKERNRLATDAQERKRLKAGYGDYEATGRAAVIRRTQRGIKHVLTERYYAWEDARKIANADPDIDLSGQGPAYKRVDEDNFEDEEPQMDNNIHRSGSGALHGGTTSSNKSCLRRNAEQYKQASCRLSTTSQVAELAYHALTTASNVMLLPPKHGFVPRFGTPSGFREDKLCLPPRAEYPEYNGFFDRWLQSSPMSSEEQKQEQHGLNSRHMPNQVPKTTVLLRKRTNPNMDCGHPWNNGRCSTKCLLEEPRYGHSGT